jgi:hypothetical protein
MKANIVKVRYSLADLGGKKTVMGLCEYIVLNNYNYYPIFKRNPVSNKIDQIDDLSIEPGFGFGGGGGGGGGGGRRRTHSKQRPPLCMISKPLAAFVDEEVKRKKAMA